MGFAKIADSNLEFMISFGANLKLKDFLIHFGKIKTQNISDIESDHINFTKKHGVNEIV